MIAVALLMVLVWGLGYLALAASALNRERIDAAVEGSASPGHGPMNVSNVQGGLWDGAHGANVPQDRFDHHNYYAHRVGGSTAVGGTAPGSCASTTLPNCMGGCGQAMPATNWVKAQTVAASLLTAGADTTIDLSGVPNMRDGLHAHVVGIRLVGVHRFVSDGANIAYTGYQQLAVWARIFLEVAGWQYLAASEGRILFNDRWLRSFSQSTFDAPPPDIAANTPAGNIDQDVTMYWPLTRPYAGGGDALKDCIPLRNLQNQGASAFRFGAPSSLVGVAPNAPPAGLTPGGFQGLTEIWLELLYLPKVFADRPFQVERYEEPLLSGNLRRPDRTTEYAVIQPNPEDSGGMYINDFDGATFMVNGQTIASALTLAQTRTRTASTMDEDPRWVDPTPPLVVGGFARMMFIVGPLPRRRAGMASGVIGFEFAQRTRNATPFLMRTIACHSTDLIGKLGLAGAEMVSLDHNDNTVAPSKMLPIVIDPATMPAKK